MDKVLILFLILLFGLVLCYILGGATCKEGLTSNETGVSGAGTGLYPNTMTNDGDDIVDDTKGTTSNNNYDYYNHYKGTSSQLVNNMNFYGPKGEIATVNTNSDGTQTIIVKLKNDGNPILFSVTKPAIDDSTNTDGSANNDTINSNIFYGPNGSIAKIVNTSNGQQAIKVKTQNGIMMFSLVGPDVNDNTGMSSTQYYGSTGTQIPQSNSSLAPTNTVNSVSYQSQTPYKASVESITVPNGNSEFYAKGPYDNVDVGINYNPYSSSLPQGIPKNQIPPGDEDLYILKSQVVPPVCPVCPTGSCEKEKECPACPPCGRCPEPAFECKKVPNYNSINNTYLPVPVVNNFSTFGM